MSYRSPMRREWERQKPALLAQSTAFGNGAAMARAMLALMPALIEFMEGELQRQTRPTLALEAITGALANVVFQSITATVDGGDQQHALRIFHQLIEREVAPRLEGRYGTTALILPGAMN